MQKKYIAMYLGIMAVILCSIIAIITFQLNKVTINQTQRINIATDVEVETDLNNVFKNKVNLKDFIINGDNNEDKLYPYEDSNGLVGYINNYGEIKIKAKYEDGDPFYEGLAPIEINNKWGYIDITGKIVIEPQYDYAYSFRNGFAEVGFYGEDIDNDRCIVINKDNKQIIEEKGVYADTTNEGYIILWNMDSEKFYDLNGERLSQLDKYEIYDEFEGDFLFAWKGNKAYLLNREFQKVKFNHLSIADFNNGIIELEQEEGPYIYLNKELNPLYLKEEYNTLITFTGGDEIAAVTAYRSEDYYYTYINYSGEKLFSSNCMFIAPFINGVAAANNLDTGEYCVISNKGEILDEGYDDIKVVNNEIIIVSKDTYKECNVKKIGGEYIIDENYDSIENYNNCFVCVKYDDNIYDIYNIAGEKIDGAQGFIVDKIDNSMLSLSKEEGKNQYYLNTETCEVIPYKKIGGE